MERDRYGSKDVKHLVKKTPKICGKWMFVPPSGPQVLTRRQFQPMKGAQKAGFQP
jgi:N-acyl-L-homoserine lactone synthetase